MFPGPVLTAISRTLLPLYEFLYPPICLLCAERLGDGERHVCSGCWPGAETLSHESALYMSQRERIIGQGCADLVGLYHFRKDGPVQDIIHHLKYGGMSSLGVELGRRLGHALNEASLQKGIAGVIPVPLHRGKKRERGYNQSCHIARGICKVTGLHLTDGLLLRRIYTATQTHLSADERAKNVKGAFLVPSGYRPTIRGKRFVLVDDVMTTGATAASAAQTLVDAGSLPPVLCVVALAE